MPLKHSVESVETAGGTRGLILNVPGAKVVHYEIFFRAGYLHVAPPMRQQTAHVLEHILYGWVNDERYPKKRDYLNEIYANGAYANATTYYNGSWHWGDNTRDEWKRVLELRRLAICQPQLTQQALKAERGNAKDEMRSNISNYERLSSEQARNGFGFPSETSPQKIASIDDISLDDVKELYTSAYTKANMKFILAGDFEHDHDEIVDFFSSWTLEDGVELSPPKYDLTRDGVSLYTHVPEVPNIFFNLSMAIERRLSAVEQRALELLNDRLFNVQNALVFEEARNRGICYRMSGRVDMDVAGLSLWQIGFPVAGDSMAELIELVVQGLATVATNGLSDEDFNRALRYSRGKFTQKGQTVSQLSDLYFGAFFDDKRAEPLDESVYDELLPETVAAVAREFLQSRTWVLSGVGGSKESLFTDATKKLVQFLKEKEL